MPYEIAAKKIVIKKGYISLMPSLAKTYSSSRKVAEETETVIKRDFKTSFK